MVKGLVAEADVLINASPERVWEALTTPRIIKQYFFGSDVSSDWKPGSPITWSGQWQGKPYEDKGKVLEVQPRRRLVVTHWSPLDGSTDSPENYHTLNYQLSAEGLGTRVSLQQDNNASEDEAAHSAANWRMMLNSLKDLLEGKAPSAG